MANPQPCNTALIEAMRKLAETKKIKLDVAVAIFPKGEKYYDVKIVGMLDDAPNPQLQVLVADRWVPHSLTTLKGLELAKAAKIDQPHFFAEGPNMMDNPTLRRCWRYVGPWESGQEIRVGYNPI